MRPLGSKHKAVRNARSRLVHRNDRKSSRMANPAESRRQNFGRRMHFRDGPVSRFLRDMRRRLIFRRAVLYLLGSLFALILIAALFVGGYIRAAADTFNAAAARVSADAGFGISELHLSGQDRTPPQTILAVLNLTPGQSIFAANLRMARARLMLLPWVAQADVTRRYPDSITVSIVEKHPFALWQSAKGLFAIERSGAVIARAVPKDFPHLPVFVGGAPDGGGELVDAVAGHRAVVARVRAMERVSGRRWNLIFDDGVVVKLPEKDWQQQLGVLDRLIVDKGILERDITEIDLRSRDNYFFVLHGANKKVARENAA